MDREYTVQLFDLLPTEQRKKVLQKIKANIPGFRKIDSAPAVILKSTLKSNEKFAAHFLDAVVDMYGCSPEQEDQLPELTRNNFWGIFAQKCKNSTGNQESRKILEEMLQEYQNLPVFNLSSNTEDTVAPFATSEQLEEKGSEIAGIKVEVEEFSNIEDADQEEDYMSELIQYIGYIQESHGFYNFWPMYIVKPDSVEHLDPNDAKLQFPELGNINLYSQERSYVSKRFVNGDIVVLTLAESDLDDNRRPDGVFQKTKRKIDLKKLERQDKINRLADIKMYPVLHPVNPIDFTKATITAEEEYVDVNDRYFIEESGILYGPYAVKLDADGKAFVNRPSNYVFDSYQSRSGELDDIIIPIDISGDSRFSISIVRIDNKLIHEQHDKIQDQELFQAFLNSLESRKIHNLNEITPDFVNEYANTLFRGLSDEIICNRVQRIQQFVEEQFRQEESLEDISCFVADILFKYGETDYFSDLMELVLNNSDLARKIQSFAIVEQRLQDMRLQYDELEQKREEAKRKWDEETEDRNKQIEELASSTNDEIRMLSAQKDSLQVEILEIQAKREEWRKIDDLEIERKVLERRRSDLQKELNDLEQAKDDAQKALEEKLTETAKNTVNAAFDGKIADQVLEAAAKWNQTTQDGNFKRIAGVLEKSNEISNLSGNEQLVNYLLDGVQRYRPGYSRNEILNIFLCISQSFLTVFSGEPGTGKTSISNIVAHILGTSKIKGYLPEENEIELSRYVPISIERGWTSKRDFIGYYNPLSKAFEQANKHLYDGLRLLDAEGEQSKYPYIVLLDEANLSPIEYYWADFMNICDSDSRFSKITLGNEIQLKIPPTLRFLATINNDDTTERLSPRLIDRAALIRLPNVPYTKVEDEDLKDTSFVHVVEWSALQAVFAPFTPDSLLDLDAMPNKIYEDICKLFRENQRLSVSPRVDRAVRRYWTTAKNLFESESGNDTTIIALDYAVAQKLLPKINGNGKTYLDFLAKFQELCEKNNLEKSRAMLTNIIKRGEASMNYFQYF